MARVRPIKTAAQASAAYGTKGSSAASSTAWAAGMTVDLAAIFDAAAAAGPRWQAAVQDPQALINLRSGLVKAKNNISTITTKITGVGKSSFSAGVLAASTGNYLAFSQAWQTAVGTEVATLDRTNPRGDRAANRARQAAYDTWVDSQAGKFRQ